MANCLDVTGLDQAVQVRPGYAEDSGRFGDGEIQRIGHERSRTVLSTGFGIRSSPALRGVTPPTRNL
jgi:hypothetical protein